MISFQYHWPTHGLHNRHFGRRSRGHKHTRGSKVSRSQPNAPACCWAPQERGSVLHDEWLSNQRKQQMQVASTTYDTVRMGFTRIIMLFISLALYCNVNRPPGFAGKHSPEGLVEGHDTSGASLNQNPQRPWRRNLTLRQ